MDDSLRLATRVRHRVAARVVGAALLGIATLLVPKADPAEHWATPPRNAVVEVQEDPADPDATLDEVDIALLLAGSGSA